MAPNPISTASEGASSGPGAAARAGENAAGRHRPGPAGLLDWLRLVRLPNIFTDISDVLMGYAVAHQGWSPPLGLALLLVASGLIYTAGMVLNDVWDYEVDLRERPSRPLPSGRISLGLARGLGLGLLAAGVAVAAASGPLAAAPAVSWRPGLLAVLLAVCVLAYNAGLKNTLLGPLAMGSCRLLNLLMAMSLAAPTIDSVAGYAPHQWLVAGGVGLYIVGVTVFSRSEATHCDRRLLVPGFLLMLAGIAGLASFSTVVDPGRLRVEPSTGSLLFLILALVIVRRCGSAIIQPEPRVVQLAVKVCILSLIMFDAALVVQVAAWPLAAATALLILPALLLGKWVYST